MFRMWEYVAYPDISYNPVNPDRSYAVGENALTPVSSTGQALTLSQREREQLSTA